MGCYSLGIYAYSSFQSGQEPIPVILPRPLPLLRAPLTWGWKWLLSAMRWTPNYSVACTIQKRILAMMQTKEDLTPAELSSLSGAWEKLEERKRILRMKPLPKAQDVSIKQKVARQPTFTE